MKARSETKEVYNANWRQVRLAVLERDGWRCQIAGERCMGVAREADHIVPWRQGGALYDLANLRAACKRCNASRVDRGERGPRPSREW